MWNDSTIEIPSEIMMYGCHIIAPSGNGMVNPYYYTVSKVQLATLSTFPAFINPDRSAQWLRDVVSASAFANISANGYANESVASNNLGIRPVFGIK